MEGNAPGWLVSSSFAASHQDQARASGCAEGLETLVRALDRVPPLDRRAVRGRQVLEHCRQGALTLPPPRGRG